MSSKKVPSTFKTLDARTYEDFQRYYNNEHVVWEVLKKVLEDKLEAKRKESEDPGIFELPGFRGKQDHLKGQIYILRQILNLFPSDNGV